MNKNICRVIALVLVIVMLAGCISCNAPEEPKTPTVSYDKDRRFELIREPASYGEEFIERAASDFADIGERTVLLTKNIKITEKQKTELKNYFKTEIFPIIVMAQIYSGEVDVLFPAILDYLDEAKEQTSFEMLAGLYRTATDAIDAKRVGIVAYEMSKLMISERAEECRERYEKHGYQWYLDDALEYEALLEGLTKNLGKAKFIAASDIIFFILSSIYGIGMPENELGLSINGKETAAILEMQADHFLEAGITAEDWSIFAGVLTELVPENKTSHMNAELYALKQGDHFVSCAAVMPCVLQLYAAATDKLYESGESAFSEEKEVNTGALLRAVLASDAELRALLDKLQTHASTDTKPEADAVVSLKLTEEYAAFTAEYAPTDADGLIAALGALAASEAPISGEALRRELLRYTVGIAPYLAFAIYDQK